jgi:Domain of unknown function (DUF6457)
MGELDDWLAEVAVALGVPADAVRRDMVLDVTRDVAHGVARPAAPLTAYLIGVAVGRGTDPAVAVATVTRMAHDWAQPGE